MSNGDTETTSPSSQAVSYPRLPPRQFAAMNPEEYIAERLNESLVWYDKSAKRNKSWDLRMSAVTIISGAWFQCSSISTSLTSTSVPQCLV